MSDVDAAFAPGTLTAVCGPNGAGKTTFIKAALGVVKPKAGRVRLFGREPHQVAPDARAGLAGYLPQERRIGWGMSALRIAALGAITAAPADAEARALAALERVGLSGLADRGVFEMSGGERARVLLARLLVTGAPLLLADEPVAGLDPDAQLLTLELLRAETARGATAIVTLHDLSLAARFCDQVLVLDHGRAAAQGAPLEALSPAVLKSAFHLDAAWTDTPHGPVLSSARVSPLD
nr:ABC transporter ATP-binding protein [Caulobacter sp. 17J80-11]